MGWNSLDDMKLSGKRVLVRVDINVPMDNGIITDDTRIQKIVPTVRYILDAGGVPILLAHYGRPKGQRNKDMSLQPLAPALEKELEAPILFAADCIGSPVKAALAAAPAGTVILLENTRFHKGEETNNPDFTQELAKNGDIFCNDAFSAAHRAHASTTGLAAILPSCAGRLMQAELTALEQALGQPKRPVVAIVGGAKVSTKLDLLKNLVDKVDHLVIGGGMANTFLAALDKNVGKSLAEHDMTNTANEILEKAAAVNCEIILPIDIVVANEFAANANNKTYPSDACPSDAMILDAGPKTVEKISTTFEQASTVIWNGPLGAFEIEPFDYATNATAQKAAELSKSGKLISVAGGGDTVAALNKAGVSDKFSYISTAGGAFLEWMEGKTLPGVAALNS